MQYQQEFSGGQPASWAEIRGMIIVIMFVLLAGDFSWFTSLPSGHVLPGTPEWDRCVKDYSEAMRFFQNSVKEDNVSLEKNSDVQIRVSNLLDRMGITGSQTELIAVKSREIFIRNWVSDNPWPKDKKKSPLEKEARRRSEAETEFHIQWICGQDLATKKYNGEHSSLLAKVGWFACTKWLVKWYFLLTLPAFVIVLLHKRDKGSSVKEEAVLRYQEWLLAFLSGPIGMLVMSGTGAKSYRYYQLLEQFRLENPERFWPEPEEEQALWRQVEQPLLDFDQAIAAVRSGEVVRKPALACLIVWLLGIFHASVAVKQATEPVAVYLTTTFTSADVSSITASDSGHHPLLLALVSQPFENKITVTEEWFGDQQRTKVKSTVRLTKSPRSPPAAVKEQPWTSMSLILDCTTQKRG